MFLLLGMLVRLWFVGRFGCMVGFMRGVYDEEFWILDM